jgi:hypothetical protein
MPIAGRRLNTIGAVLAAVAVLLLLLRALGRFDDSWDGTHYHLVFSAFRARILTFETFQPLPFIVSLYNSFPPLLDVVRGYVWRVTGSILILQTFNLAAIAALVTFWKLNFGLSIRWSIIAILSVPLIQISATTLYVDTFVNCIFAIPLSILSVAFIDRRPLTRNEGVLSLVALAVCGNVKPQFVVLGTVLLTVLCIFQTWHLWQQGRRRELGRFLALAAISYLVVPATGIHNLLVHGNPTYPLAISVLGKSLPGMFPLEATWKAPDYLAHVSQPVRWLASILEFRAFEGAEIPYTIDQFNPIPIGTMPDIVSRPPSMRMGGYFFPLVLALLMWLVVFTRQYIAQERLRWFIPLICVSFIAFVPGSNELRYYSFWMLTLIFLCFLAANRAHENEYAGLFHGSMLVAFISVGVITGWRYFDPRPYSVQDHIRKHGMDRVVTGQDLCFENRSRDTILFTWIFHAKGHYRVVDLSPGERCPQK